MATGEIMDIHGESAGEAVRILLVDDDRKYARLIREYLAPQGFEVTTAFDGRSGLELALNEPWQAVILDVMMPEMNGIEVLREIRRHSRVPILMLTALGEETDRIVGLEVGADDYLPKTFSTRELLARLRAVLRRAELAGPRPGEVEAIVHGELEIRAEARTATLAGKPLALTPVEFDLLHCLARSAGRVKTRDQLLDEIRSREYDVFDRSIDVHISGLRRKLGDDPRRPRFIRTVRTIGYMFAADGDATS
ncbi:MAG: response regulator transcription factor [Gammaproteobacteria bacterium]|jgi:DNA-binding response OmpR family regulator